MKYFLALVLFLQCHFLNAKENIWQGVTFAQFELADQTGEIHSNKDYLGQWFIIYFYPKDKTPGCSIEAQNFADDYSKFKALNVEIIGVSYDDQKSHKEFSDIYDLKFSLLSDTQHTLAKSMKVDAFFPWPHSSRETFLVNPKGIIIKHYQNVAVKTHSSQLLNDLKLILKKTNL